jgi:hypothetical protein
MPSLRAMEKNVQQSATIKKRATAEEIQAELKQRIEMCADRDGNCRGCEAPAPRPVTPKEEGGSNWIVESLPGLAPGCFGAILKIVDQARLEYELIS